MAARVHAVAQGSLLLFFHVFVGATVIGSVFIWYGCMELLLIGKNCQFNAYMA